MKKEEKYNLQRVLEMRETARDQAALYLAECRQKLALEEEELNARKQTVENCRREQTETQNALTEKTRAGIKSIEIVRFRQYLIDLREKEKRLLKEVEDQKAAVERAEKKVEKALGELNETARELKVIEKHRENWQTANKKTAERREQKSNDETGAILYERRKFE